MTEIIDIHPHVIAADQARFPLAPLGGKRSSWSRDHVIGHDELVGAMDQAGIAKAVVVQASTAYGHDNSYLASAIAAHPDRFTGIFSIDALADDAVDKIEFWRAKGLTGMRLFTAGSTLQGQGDWLGDPASYPAWAHAEAIGLPVCVQMRPEGLGRLRGLLERFPKAIVVLDHLARADLSDGAPYQNSAALWQLAEFEGVHLILTLRNIYGAQTGASTLPEFLDHMLATFGAKRVAWGSNFPAAEMSLPELAQKAKEALRDLAPADQAEIFAGTAKRLYPVLTQLGEKAA
jgi:predicted TIM-barrel fold metal-dependent hydrolase